MATSWPAFADQLHRHTPYRSVLVVPLDSIGAIDLYFTHPDGGAGQDLPAALPVTEQVVTALTDDPVLTEMNPCGPWQLPAMAGRVQVPMALGMLTVALRLNYADALAVLRGYAFAADRSVDDVARDLVTGVLQADQLNS